MLRAFSEAVARCQAGSALARHLPPLPDEGRLVLVAAGKGAGPMAEAAERHYADDLSGGRIGGVAVMPNGPSPSLEVLETRHASHPVPDDDSVAAAHAILAAVDGLSRHDHVVVLLSGGASALVCAPIDGVTLADKRNLTEQLLASGAGIAEINAVRTCLSDIKGGKLARACSPARVTTLAISDVAGDQPTVIGSGPTVDTAVSPQRVLEIAEQYHLELPRGIVDHAERAAQSVVGEFPPSDYKIIVRPMDALSAAAEVAESNGYEAIILGDAIEGEARSVAAEIAKECTRHDYEKRKVALLSGGEVTVTIDPGANGTYGGSNRELALALAGALPDAPRVDALIADTDGSDGQPGTAGPVAGAFVDSETVARAQAIGLDVDECLRRHLSGTFFEKLNDEFITGPTNTNVNDFRMLLIN